MKILFVFHVLLFGALYASCDDTADDDDDDDDIEEYPDCDRCSNTMYIYCRVRSNFIIRCGHEEDTMTFIAGIYGIPVCPGDNSLGGLDENGQNICDISSTGVVDIYTCTDYNRTILLIAAIRECRKYTNISDRSVNCGSFELEGGQNCSVTTNVTGTVNGTVNVNVTGYVNGTVNVNVTGYVTGTGTGTGTGKEAFNVIILYGVLTPIFLFLLVALIVGIIVAISVICFLTFGRKPINKAGIELRNRNSTNPNMVTENSILYTNILENNNLEDRICTHSKYSQGSGAINTYLSPLSPSEEPYTPTSGPYGLVVNCLYAGFVEGEFVDTKLYEKLPCMKNQQRDLMEENPLYNSKELALQFIEPSNSIPELLTQCCLYEINENDLVMGGMIASGEFGLVYRAIYKIGKGDIPVAVKTLKESANKDTKITFMKEAATMAQFSHPNVLRLIGVITTQNTCMIVTELLKTELRELLIKFRDVPDNGDIHQLLFKFTQEIAAGMEYLAKIKFVHRDLAARNVLVAKDLTIRVADFGMSREVVSEKNYYTSSGGIVPLRWTAPEAVFYKRFSEKTDVWSFGMTLFEIWTLGDKPWGEATNNEIIENLSLMKTLSPPHGCPEEISRVMLKTWKYDQDDRPTFSEVRDMLSAVTLSINTSNTPILNWN